MAPSVIEKAQLSFSFNDKDIDTTKIDDPQSESEIVDHDDYPDGGLRAWLIVLGVCAILTCFMAVI